MTAPSVFASATGLAPCGVRHVDLDRGERAIAAGAGERSVYAVFWRGGCPIGDRLFVAAELPVPGSAVATLAADAAAANSSMSVGIAPAGRPLPAVSVVICTRERPDSLARCLASLALCDPPPAEVLVVDNAPGSDATRSIVDRSPGTRYVAEPRPGLSYARNRGIEVASQQVIAFTDDDVEVARNWIARLTAPFADPAVACVTGAVLPADLSGEGACLFEFSCGGLNNGFGGKRHDPRFLDREWWKSPPVWTIGAGANMAVRRSAFAAVGLFDPRLGAGAAGCSEDSEFWFRLLHSGLTCVYEPAAVVHHHHRRDRDGVFRQMRAYIRGHVVALFVQYARDRRAAHLLRAFVLIPVHYLRSTFGAVRRGKWPEARLNAVQMRGWAEGLIGAVRWLREPGAPRLEHRGDRP